MINRLEAEDLGVGIELSIERGRTNMLYLVPPTTELGRIVEVLREIEATVLAHETTRERAEELMRCREEINSVLETVSARIKDPHPIRETVVDAVQSLFGR
jgi:hypothetical protein